MEKNFLNTNLCIHCKKEMRDCDTHNFCTECRDLIMQYDLLFPELSDIDKIKIVSKLNTQKQKKEIKIQNRKDKRCKIANKQCEYKSVCTFESYNPYCQIQILLSNFGFNHD